MAKTIMIQGTMSNAGKSLLAAGLCRVLKQDGYRVAPFKSQNMALNSFITKDGGEMGRAQVVQAEAAGIEPDVRMNPILLKPTTDIGSQVIVNGRVQGNMPAMEYYRRKRDFIPAVMEAYESLARGVRHHRHRGRGQPRGNQFAGKRHRQHGSCAAWWMRRCCWWATSTAAACSPSSTARSRCKVKRTEGASRALLSTNSAVTAPILEPGLKTLEELCGVPVAGVVPYLHVDIDDEDSLSERFGRDKRAAAHRHCGHPPAAHFELYGFFAV